MASTSYYQYQHQPTGTLPVNVPTKGGQLPYGVRPARASSIYSQLSASPPERPESVSSSGAGLYSAPSASYASSEYDSAGGATSVDLLDYMNDRLSSAYNPIPLDKNMAKQAQMSGALNAKNRELLELQAQARARLSRTRANFAEGMQAARDVQRDLQWTQKKVSTLNARAAQKYPDQYRVASQRHPTMTDY